MKNIFNTEENLELFNENGVKVYEYLKDSDGYIYEYTYDSNGKVLTYKNSKGETRGFDVPEYTMEELVKKIGNFKIKK